MKGKNIVLTVAVVAACAGSAMAAPVAPQAKMVKANMVPTRIDPVGIAPLYLIDGVEVVGEEIPYSSIVRPQVDARKAIFDQYDGDPAVAADYPPVNRGGPCGGAGFLFTNGTDTAATNYYQVNVSHSTDDYKGVDAFGVGKNVTGCALLWNHLTSPMVWVIRSLDTFNDANSATFGAAGARTRTYSGTQTIGVIVYYDAADAPIAGGFYYSYVDWQGAIVQPALLDTDGAVNFAFYTSHTTVTAATINWGEQPAIWGTRADELPAPSSLPRAGGPQNPLWFIDDSGALASTSGYVFGPGNGILTPNGADAGPNESYAMGPSTDPLDCFASTGICWALFVQECVAQDAATLSTPAHGATGVTNNLPGPSFEWAPGAVIATDYSCNIYQNNVLVHTMNGILTTTFDLDIALAPNCYEWSMVSNAGAGCPGTESARNEFAMVGADCNPPCVADFNGDTVVDFFDYLDFVDAFSANDPSADFNGDTVIDFFDYLDFVDAFSTGC